MDRTIQMLRLNMEGRWLAEELGCCVSDLTALYDLRMCLELMREDETDWELFFDEYQARPISELRQRLSPAPRALILGIRSWGCAPGFMLTPAPKV